MVMHIFNIQWFSAVCSAVSDREVSSTSSWTGGRLCVKWRTTSPPVLQEDSPSCLQSWWQHLQGH